MKKILFLIHDLGPGGAEKVLVNLLNHLDRTKFDITLLALFGGGVNEQFLRKDIEYRVVFPKTFRGNSKIMKLFSPEMLHGLFIKEKYDIEIAYLEGPSARIISGCRDKGTKMAAWVHGQIHTKKRAAASFRSYAEAAACYGRLDQVIFVSESVREDFQALFPGTKGTVLFNTVDARQIQKKSLVPVGKEIFKENEIKLCGVGRLIPGKGFDRLAKIHVRLRWEGFPVHTYLLGDGPERENLSQYIQEQGCSDTFTFLGYQTNPYPYLAGCDLFVCSSYSEGFSTAATEALILGTAVVTTPVSGMKEMLGSNNEYGVITGPSEEDLYQGVRSLVSDPVALEEYRERAKTRGQKFSTERTVKAVEKMLEEL